MLPATVAHTNTYGRQASDLESLVQAEVLKDRCRAISKNPETPTNIKRFAEHVSASVPTASTGIVVSQHCAASERSAPLPA
jgi:hypothetical protein